MAYMASESTYIGGWGGRALAAPAGKSFRFGRAWRARRDATRDHCTLGRFVPRTASTLLLLLLLLRARALGFVSDLARIWLAVGSFLSLLFSFVCFVFEVVLLLLLLPARGLCLLPWLLARGSPAPPAPPPS